MNRNQPAVSNRRQGKNLTHGKKATQIAVLAFAAGAAHQAIFSPAVQGASYTWTQTAAGTYTWSNAADWAAPAPTAASSSTSTVITFFDSANLTGPASGTTVEADNDLANPFIMNVLNLDGTTTTSGPGAIINIGGNELQLDGTNAQINFNASYGQSTDAGTTYNINANVLFNTATTLTFANNGGNLNFNDALAGSGNLTIDDNATNRYVNLNGNSTVGSTYTGNVLVNTGVLRLANVANILGADASGTQTITVNAGASLVYDQANGEFNELQTLILNGSGTGQTGLLGADAALDVNAIDYNNMYLGHGIALASNSTIRVDEGNTSSNSWGVFLNGGPGLVGTGNLTKAGTGDLILGQTSNATASISGFSAYTGNVNVNQGVLVTWGTSNTLGTNASGTQTVTVASGASAAVVSYQYGAVNDPQIFVINGTGTASTIAESLGTDAALQSLMSNDASNTIGGLVVATNSTVRVNGLASPIPTGPNFGLTVNGPLAGTGNLTKIGSNNDVYSLWYYPGTQVTTDGTLEFNASAAAVGTFPAFTGNVTVPANCGILATGHADDALGANTSGTQLVSIGSGSNMLFDEGNAAFNNPQNFIINGAGTGDSVALTGTQAGSDSAMEALEVNFANVRIGGLDIATSSTIRVNTHTGPSNPNLGIQVNGPLAGSGNLTIIGNTNDTIENQSVTDVEGYGTVILTATAGPVAGSSDAAFTGNLTVGQNAGSAGPVLELGPVADPLGTNNAGAGSQSVTVTNGSAVVINGANGAYPNPQIFVINGTGTGDSTSGALGANAALQATNINFANASIGGLNLASNSTVSVTSTVGFGLQVNSGLAGSGNLTLIGGGELILSAASNGYSGSTVSVSGATLSAANSSGSATGSAAVTLTGGTLVSGTAGAITGNVSADAASIIAPGGIGSIGTLALGGLTTSSGTTLNFDLGSGAGPKITNGDLLTLGSGTTSIASGTLLTFGGTTTGGDDYRLIGGTLTGITLSNFTLPTAPAGETFALSESVDSGFIDLVVTGSGGGLTWSDASGDNLWNTTSSNWNNGSSNTTFSNGSAVTFNDNNTGHYSVTLNSAVAPSSITANNSAGHYIISGAGSIATTGALNKSGTGVFTIATPGTSVGAVSITGGSLQLGASTGLATIKSLAISGNGTFDINNNHVVLNYGAGTDPIASIAALIKTGYNAGNWNGAGGIISTAAQTNNATAGNLLYGLGYADSADPGNPAGLATDTIEIKYTLLGDANLSGTVDGTDFGILAANFNKGVTGWDQGDFNYNNVVDGTDFGLMAANFNKGATGASIGAPAIDDPAIVAFAQANGLMSELTASVPEPATISSLLVIAGALGARRRRSTASI